MTARTTCVLSALFALTVSSCGAGTAAPPESTSNTTTTVTTTTKAPYPPAVDYTPHVPERTRKTATGHQVNTCVPEALDKNVFTLTTSDGVRLSAMELGSGDRGVLLSHEQGYYMCSWLALGEELAAAGYHVVLFEYRNHGASETSEDNDHIDRDTRAALAALHSFGAERVLLGGASCGGTSSAVTAADEPKLTGLLILSSPAKCAGQDGEAAARRITAPSFFAVSPEDYSGNMIKETRRLYEASAAADKHLEIVPGGRHGTDMLRHDDPEKLHQLVRDFIDSAFRG
ncbi:alpha/beta hydrolase [Lentzea sp. NPDC092896]|uniref:alpha/beta hydrolase n=1 Tax=Lentzea sp. NPDC092896 TaxID=3364127 RepID=UPI00380D6C0D